MTTKSAKIKSQIAKATKDCQDGKHTIPVEVIVWPMKLGDVGHTALRIGDTVLGYYPTDVNGDGQYTKTDLSNSPGDLHVDTIGRARANYGGDKIIIYTLLVNCEQLLCLLNFFLQLLKKPGTYKLLSRNCTTTVADALAHCGFDMTARFNYPAEKFAELDLITPGNARIAKAGICFHTVELDHGSVISPTDMTNRLKGKPFVKGVKEETVK